MRWLAIDIGGANIKLADGQRFAQSHFFPLWQKPSKLEQELRMLIVQAPPCDHIAATMTGELADCFATREEGVRHIIDAFVRASDQRHMRIYRLDGKIVTPQVALDKPLQCAATNWHALARFAGRFAMSGSALLVDIGSTTCDLIWLENGQPRPQATADRDRLLTGELVYTGVDRSPVCAVARSIPHRGRRCPLAHELFANMLDVYLTLGDLPEEPTNNVTADGRPATREYALGRLARAICTDRTQFTQLDADEAAREIAKDQLALLTSALQTVLSQHASPPGTVIMSGAGEFLVPRMLAAAGLQCSTLSLGDRLGPKVSRCATAHALAVLANEV
jgi:hypothetical protein